MEGGGLQIPNEHDEWMDVIFTIFQKTYYKGIGDLIFGHLSIPTIELSVFASWFI